jgi:hypothetical protein
MGRFTYDTEFLDEGGYVDLISIGMINMDSGEEYYAVSNEFDTIKVADNWWLMENVMNSIEHEDFLDAHPITGMPVKNLLITDPGAKSRVQIADDIKYFMAVGYENELWAWFGAYDHICLAQLWGPMMNLPPHIPMFTNDLKTLHKAAGYCPLPAQPPGKHNALEDAKHNVVKYEYLVDKLGWEAWELKSNEA